MEPPNFEARVGFIGLAFAARRSLRTLQGICRQTCPDVSFIGIVDSVAQELILSLEIKTGVKEHLYS